MAADRPLVTLGITASGPETGYGYVVADRPRAEAGAHAVRRFVEKPARDVAAALLAGPDPVAWNAGIFVWQRAAIVAALDASAPDILAAVREGVSGGSAGIEEAYATLRATSIDYAVMEPAPRRRVGWPCCAPTSAGATWAAGRPCVTPWWRARQLRGSRPATVGSGARRDVGSEGTLVMAGDRLVVTIGLRDTIVVDTPDAVLVCAADRSQEVRGIAEELAAGRRSTS